MHFEFQFKAGTASERIEPDQPMKLLLMANFSGHNPPSVALTQRRARKVDIDNMDQVLAACAPRLQISLPELGQADLQLEFHSLDDFHPDHLFSSLPLFQSLRSTRQDLQNPSSFERAAQSLRGALPELAPASVANVPAANPSASGMSDFEALLGGKVKTGTAPAKNDFEALIRSIAAPLIVAGHDASMYVAAVDEAISSLMRAILSHPEFQQLEASWRGVHFLITNLDLEQSLQLHLFDVSKAELAQDLATARADLSRAQIYHLLVESARQAPDATPWAVLMGDYHFDTSENDIAQLAAIGAVAAQAGAPFLAAASSSILGCDNLLEQTEPRDWPALADEDAARWQALRRSPQAQWLGLVLPRLLMRLPYGKTTDTVEQFAFEEMPSQHQAFLWGNPALACGLLLAQAYQEDAWEMRAGSLLEIGDLPAYTFKQDGQSYLLPAAEICMLERASEAVLTAGLMPLLSYKNRNAVRLLRMQSIAAPAKALAGAWL